MITTHGINESQVFEIADKIKRLGNEPTLQAIREELGRGSFATISRHLKSWKDQKAAESQPPSPPDEMMSLFHRVWNATYRQAEKLLASEKEVLALEKEKFEDEKNQILVALEKVETERDGTLKRVLELEKTIESFTLKLSQKEQAEKELRETLVRTQAQLESSESRRLEALTRADRLESNLTQFLKTSPGKEVFPTA